jgi:hypothetical protein
VRFASGGENWLNGSVLCPASLYLMAMYLTLLPVGAVAMETTFTGDRFYSKCNKVNLTKGEETPNEAVQRALSAGSCSGFVGGVVKGVNLVGNMLQAQGAAQRNFICLPQGQHAMDLVRAVTTYIDSHDEVKSLPAQAAVYAALVEKFPCKA